MVRIAAAQIRVVEDIDVNLNKMLDFIDEAESKDVDIVCFPETCLNSKEEGIDVSRQIAKIQERCRERSIWCIFGTYVPVDDRTMNSIFLINRSGEVEYRYDKVHLWLSERGKITPGKTNKVIDMEFGKIGIIDCWDFAYPCYIKELSKKGAKIIFCPAYLVDYEKDTDVMRAIPLVRAFENTCYYVCCDAFTEETLSESFICHPLKILKNIQAKEGMILADLNLDEIDSLREYYRLLD